MTVWLGIEFRLTAVFPQLLKDVMSFSPDVSYCWQKILSKTDCPSCLGNLSFLSGALGILSLSLMVWSFSSKCLSGDFFFSSGLYQLVLGITFQSEDLYPLTPILKVSGRLYALSPILLLCWSVSLECLLIEFLFKKYFLLKHSWFTTLC